MPGHNLEFLCERGRQDEEHILKALNSLQTSEEKLAALCKKYTELLDEHRLLQNKTKKSERQLTMVMREKDQLQSEHSKAILAKSKLESLCRELQRHNKLVKEESLARAKEEDEKRKEVTARFQTTINEIQQQMNDHYTKNTKLREENLELANKLKNLIEQYELREQHIEKMFKHKDLEQQLMDAKLAQAVMQVSEEKKRSLAEKEFLMMEAAEGQKRILLLEAQEKQLRAQVSLYTEKYEEFQSTLTKSNDVFQSFKTEMDKMTKKIKKLEKETSVWRSRWENSNKSLIDMAEEKTKSDKEIALQQVRIKKLESLCRALQEERKKSPASGAQQLNGITDDQLKASGVALTNDAAGAAIVDKETEQAAMPLEEKTTPIDKPKEITDPVGGDTESISDEEKDVASSPQQLQSNSGDTQFQETGDLGKMEGASDVSEASDGHTGVSQVLATQGDSPTATGLPDEGETPAEIK